VNAIRLIGATIKAVPRAFALMRDSRVPAWLKIATVGAAVFVVSPFDLLGDIPVVGLFDDVALLALLANLFVGFADHSVMKQARPADATVMKQARPADPRAARTTALKS
jgi:uncharacterized membrane protein YkvA (DUF1232 family)